MPLRFTQLQNSNTMLSGVKLGRSLSNRIQASLSIYHSFYLKSFKATANLKEYDEQPRLFINCMGGELDYYFLKNEKIGLGMQLLIGWGFMTYELKKYDFASKQVNYLALEPSLNFEYKMSPDLFIGLGLGYRPVLTNRQIAFNSRISKGEIPVSRQFPNGLNLILTLKGFL